MFRTKLSQPEFSNQPTAEQHRRETRQSPKKRPTTTRTSPEAENKAEIPQAAKDLKTKVAYWDCMIASLEEEVEAKEEKVENLRRQLGEVEEKMVEVESNVEYKKKIIGAEEEQVGFESALVDAYTHLSVS